MNRIRFFAHDKKQDPNAVVMEALETGRKWAQTPVSLHRAEIHPYLIVSSGMFGLVAFLHLLRVANDWEFKFGPNKVPLWASYVAIGVPIVLSAWAITLAICSERHR